MGTFDATFFKAHYVSTVVEEWAMNTPKLNDWLQIAAAIGVIAGLLLVAYEIKVSNRVGVEQANAARFQNWAVLNEQLQSSEMSDLFVRTYEGAEFTRAEAAKYQSLIDTFLISLNYVYLLAKTDSVDYGPHFGSYHRGYIQWYLGSDFGRRYWAVTRAQWEPTFSAEIEKAVNAPDQRDVLAELDFLRGATEQNE